MKSDYIDRFLQHNVPLSRAVWFAKVFDLMLVWFIVIIEQ